MAARRTVTRTRSPRLYYYLGVTSVLIGIGIIGFSVYSSAVRNSYFRRRRYRLFLSFASGLTFIITGIYAIYAARRERISSSTAGASSVFIVTPAQTALYPDGVAPVGNFSTGDYPRQPGPVPLAPPYGVVYPAQDDNANAPPAHVPTTYVSDAPPGYEVAVTLPVEVAPKPKSEDIVIQQ